MTTPTAARTVPDLLRRLVDAGSGQPRVTWYGEGAERVELSSRVLENWVAKTCGLLLELEAGAGARVGVALPPHWRTTCWLLAAWCLDAEVVTGAEAADAEVVVSASGDVLAGAAGTPVAVALEPLATSWAGALPPGAVDAAAEVRLQPDAMPPTSGGAAVLARARAAAAATGLGDGARVLTPGRPQHAVEELLAPLAVGGSLVLARPEADAGHLLAVEQAVRLPAPAAPPPPTA